MCLFACGWVCAGTRLSGLWSQTELLRRIRSFHILHPGFWHTEAWVIALHLIYWAPSELLFNLSKIVLSGNRGKCNLIAADIEAAIDTERAGWLLYRTTSNTAHALWEDEYTQSQVCVKSSQTYTQTHTHTRMGMHAGCRLLRNLLVSFVSFLLLHYSVKTDKEIRTRHGVRSIFGRKSVWW